MMTLLLPLLHLECLLVMHKGELRDEVKVLEKAAVVVM
jgi:hypothetical protein